MANVDPKSYELAELFLSEISDLTENEKMTVAVLIQEAAEYGLWNVRNGRKK